MVTRSTTREYSAYSSPHVTYEFATDVEFYRELRMEEIDTFVELGYLHVASAKEAKSHSYTEQGILIGISLMVLRGRGSALL